MEWPSEVLLRVGEEKILRLDGFSSGGYRWQARVVPPGRVVTASVTPAPETATGKASRDELVVLRGEAAGRATVEVTLGRSWESAPVERHTIDVVVDEP
jgi:hypothetical protein